MGSNDGIGYSQNVNKDMIGVRPAFKLNRASVLRTSVSGMSKADFAKVGNSNIGANTWKLTLKGTDTTLVPSKTAGNTTLQEGYVAEKLTVSHSAATVLTEATQVSAMLMDGDGTVLCYGKINDQTSATSSYVTIPTGLAAGSYSLYVFAEDVNTGNKTDYATAVGTPIEITINAASTDPTQPPSTRPTVTTGAGGTHVAGTNGSLQITCSGALGELTGIHVDGVLVDAANYTLKPGSTILTFNPAYLNSLSVGTHTVRFLYGGEYADTTFVIAGADTTGKKPTTTPATRGEVPKTGDNTPVVLLFIVAIISGTGILYLSRKKKTVK
ncbi:MAG: LPXTG cell wall anchor domain-containing protein [Lachnospiraceae bacterium]